MERLLTFFQVGAIFLFLWLPALLTKQWWLFLMFFGFGLVFGIVELLAIKMSGLSISQHLWALREENYWKAMFVAICMAIGWGFLIYHFMVK